RDHELLTRADPVRRSEPVSRRPYAAMAAAAAVVITAVALRAPSSRSRTAAAQRAPALAGASGPASRAGSEATARARGPTAASLAVEPDDEASSEDRDLLAWVEWKYRYLL